MNKLQQLKKALASPPPERLAEIEYKSHFLQMVGIFAVCVMLIIKGFWYIIFALIFGVGVSYSQGITAYQKYKMIKSLYPVEKPEDYKKDISPSRKRSKIINFTIGGSAKWISIVFAVGLSFIIIGMEVNRWLMMIFYPVFILVIYIIFYYFVVYWAANIFYKEYLKELEGGKNNGTKEK